MKRQSVAPGWTGGGGIKLQEPEMSAPAAIVGTSKAS